MLGGDPLSMVFKKIHFRIENAIKTDTKMGVIPEKAACLFIPIVKLAANSGPAGGRMARPFAAAAR
jgi:hypothetical protein